ncbi:MAG TPA: hypothetical protein VN688_04400 [Gemmataceae bacterium]|nr:hypothetical protein [Gemmataceae bacterium]
MINAPSSLAGAGQLPPAPPRTSPQRQQGNPLLALRAGRHNASSQTKGNTALHLSLSRPRRMGRSARVVLIWFLAWYAVAQCALILVKDRWQPIAPSNESIKGPRLRELVAEEPDRPLTLMLGSSRTCWALRAGSLDGMPGPDGQPQRVYNFGIPSTGPIHEWLYLRQMVAEGIRPRLLLVEFLPPLLCAPQRGVLSEEGTTAYPWMSGRDFVRMTPYLARPGRRGRDWLQANLAPCYAFRLQLHAEVQRAAFGVPFPPLPAVDEWGWRTMTPKLLPAWERTRNVQREQGGYSPGLGHFRMGKGPKRALRDLLALCRRERIPVALVLMPESSEFRAVYSPEARAATRGLLAKLSHDYDAAVIDANLWVDDADFEDGHHVMAHGADVFTNRLRGEIQQLLMRTALRDTE